MKIIISYYDRDPITFDIYYGKGITKSLQETPQRNV